MADKNPTSWLIEQIAYLLTDDQYQSLLTGYKAQQARYRRAQKLRQARRELALYERLVNDVEVEL